MQATISQGCWRTEDHIVAERAQHCLGGVVYGLQQVQLLARCVRICRYFVVELFNERMDQVVASSIAASRLTSVLRYKDAKDLNVGRVHLPTTAEGFSHPRTWTEALTLRYFIATDGFLVKLL